MSIQVPQYRCTTDDLVDADHKLARGIGPLLDMLNRCLGAVTLTLSGVTLPTSKALSFTTAENGAAYVDIAIGRPISDIWVSGIVPNDQSTLDSVWSMAPLAQPSGSRLLFVGLAPLTTYNLRLLYL